MADVGEPSAAACTTHDLDQFARVLGRRIRAPSHMSVGPDQDEPALITLGHGGHVERSHIQGNGGVRRCGAYALAARRIPAQAEEGETAAEQIERERPSGSQAWGARAPGRAVWV